MKRNKFSLSHYKLLTMDMGQLIPLTWFEALPGDTFQLATSMLVRATPLVAPVMHPVRIRLHWWFVPNRLIWDDWENFITGGDDGDFEAQPPTIASSGLLEEKTLQDYMGLPPGDYTSNPIAYSALPFRAYNLIYNEKYRDEDLIDELTISKSSGSDTTTPTDIQRVSWEKDYFTTARPWTSKGSEILIPLGSEAPVTGIGTRTQDFPETNVLAYESDGDSRTYASAERLADTVSGSSQEAYIEEDPNRPGYPNIIADLSQATGISVNDLRNYLAQQRFQEARAQFGSRYSEYIKYLVPGIGSLDSRLQEPEFIAGGSGIISFSEILQTQRTDADQTPLGTMAGHGVSGVQMRRVRRFTPEHGIIMGLISVIPKAIYSQEVERKWHRLNKDMYFQKELQYIGEQPITNREVYAFHSDPNGTFGYNKRYDEYRFIPSSISGEFHNEADGWHYARIFSGDVALNKSFIEAVPTKRPSADQIGDCLYIMANNSIQARRILSKWATPRTF